MTTETILTVPADGGDNSDLWYDFGLSDALVAASEAATAGDDEAAHYVETDDGRAVNEIRVVREELSDGSIACKILLVLSRLAS